MPPVGFEPKISAGERPQTYALDRAATGTGTVVWYGHIITRLHGGIARKTTVSIISIFAALKT